MNEIPRSLRVSCLRDRPQITRYIEGGRGGQVEVVDVPQARGSASLLKQGVEGTEQTPGQGSRALPGSTPCTARQEVPGFQPRLRGPWARKVPREQAVVEEGAVGRPGHCDGSGVSAGEGLVVREATGHGPHAGLQAAEQPEAGEGRANTIIVRRGRQERRAVQRH